MHFLYDFDTLNFNGLFVHLHIFVYYFMINIKNCNISDVDLGQRPKIEFILFRSKNTSISSNLLT